MAAPKVIIYIVSNIFTEFARSREATNTSSTLPRALRICVWELYQRFDHFG